MNRRTFTKTASLSIAFSPFINMNNSPITNMGLVVHSYAMRYGQANNSAKYPAFTDASSLLEHCSNIGLAGVQTIIKNWSTDFCKKIRDQRENYGMYLEGSVAMPKTKEDLAQFEKDIISAKEAGASILRTVSLGGRRYEVFKNKADFDEYDKKAKLTLRMVEPILKKHKMKLGIENHKDWLATDLATELKKISSEYLGVTLDFGNSIALLEDPMHVVKTLAPYTLSAHIKDMAVNTYAQGFLLSEVPMGQGILDLPAIVAECKKYNANIKYNLEMITRPPLQIPCYTEAYYASMPKTTAKQVAKIMEMVNTKKTKEALPTLEGQSADQKMEVEEQNILASIEYSKKLL